MEKPSKKPKKIVDYRITENQIYYLVLWEDNSQEWVQDTQLVGCDRLISQYFTTRDHSQEQEIIEEETEERIKKTRHGARKEEKVAKVPKLAQWSLTSLKRKKKRRQKKDWNVLKTPSRSKKYQETQLLVRKIEQLSERIYSRSSDNKLDYLLDYIEGVFLKDNLPYCSVRTLPPARTYLVSIPDMERYFPHVLKQYYENVQSLHQKRLQEASSAFSEDEGNFSESSLQKQQHSKISEEQENE